jgi:anti-anti-sigma factor
VSLSGLYPLLFIATDLMNNNAYFSSYVVDDDILIVKLHGNLDAATTQEFNAELDKHFQQGKSKVIIDCAHLAYVSSFGIGTLVTLQTRLRKRGGEVKLAAINAMVADVFKIVHLDKMLGIYGDIEFARESFYE